MKKITYDAQPRLSTQGMAALKRATEWLESKEEFEGASVELKFSESSEFAGGPPMRIPADVDGEMWDLYIQKSGSRITNRQTKRAMYWE